MSLESFLESINFFPVIPNFIRIIHDRKHNGVSVEYIAWIPAYALTIAESVMDGTLEPSGFMVMDGWFHQAYTNGKDTVYVPHYRVASKS